MDEVGKGSLAGPVVACAVALNSKFKNQNAKLKFKSRVRTGAAGNESFALSDLKNLRDSKKLTPKKRKKFYEILTKHPGVEWGIGRVYPGVIDRINILEATKLAMVRAVEKLKVNFAEDLASSHASAKASANEKLKIGFLILDGNMKLDLPIPQKSIVKADEKVLSCAIASIIAKVKRDKAMQRYHRKYPQYGFDRHKGYGTKQHITMLNKFGRCDIHRNSFNYGRTKTATHQIKKK